LVRDTAGNLYGTTFFGGASGDGVVFKVDTAGTEIVLHSVTGPPSDGANPYAGLILAAGVLYGTTFHGGAFGDGVVFKVKTSGGETVLHSFDGADGSSSNSGLVRDAAGNLYRITEYGGASDNGVVFKLATTGRETILYTFTGSKDGGNPYRALLRNTAGTLWGTTYYGGTAPCGVEGCGVVFRLGTTGHETVLHSFAGSPTDGAYPDAGLVPDAAGNLYGTTQTAALPAAEWFSSWIRPERRPCSTAFDDTDGCEPQASLVRDTAGNFYGTTSHGGAFGYGVVFKLSP
jgi:uncharacterized repeat protein (TIGR03803 family)